MANSEKYRSNWNCAEPFNFAVDVVEAQAEREDKLALIHSDEDGHITSYSYADIADRAARLSSALHRLGLRKGDRAIVMFPRRPEWQIAMLALLRIGAVPIPCIEMLTGKDIEYRVRHSGAKAALTISRNCEKFAGSQEALEVRIAVDAPADWHDYEDLIEAVDKHVAPAVVEAEDPAILYYTSGSTGFPKGVLHASRALHAWRSSAVTWLDLGPEDTIWCTADTGWSKAGTSILFGPWSVGSAVYFSEVPYEPENRLKQIETYGVTVYCAAATELLRVADAGLGKADLTKLRRVVSAGEALNPIAVNRWNEATGIKPAEAYGQTECLMTIVTRPDMEPEPGVMGSAAPGCDIALLDDEGQNCAPGEVGQIALKVPNPQLMLEYLDEPDKTDAAFVENASGRWFLSGDLAVADERGRFVYSGRNDDIINTAGYRVGPFEIENVLLEHPAVAQCAVVGTPDADRGEVIHAFIVVREGGVASDTLIAEIQAFAKRMTAPYKYPRRITFVDELPKTLTGKIRRRALRDLHA